MIDGVKGGTKIQQNQRRLLMLIKTVENVIFDAEKSGFCGVVVAIGRLSIRVQVIFNEIVLYLCETASLQQLSQEGQLRNWTVVLVNISVQFSFFQ